MSLATSVGHVANVCVCAWERSLCLVEFVLPQPQQAQEGKAVFGGGKRRGGRIRQ